MLVNPLCARGRKAAFLRLAVLFVLHALCAGNALAQEAAEARSSDEFAKQEKIYRSEGSDVPGGYITGRSLTGYAELLPIGFNDALQRLGPTDRWLDIGAGAGQAILDYYALGADPAKDGKPAPSRGKAQVVALSIEDRRSDSLRQLAASLGGGRVRYLYGRRLREYS